MPQLNKGGKFVFGLSVVRDDLTIHSILLLTILGEFFLPWILSRHYDGYNSKMMVMSALGSSQNPVRVIYNTLTISWCQRNRL